MIAQQEIGPAEQPMDPIQNERWTVPVEREQQRDPIQNEQWTVPVEKEQPMDLVQNEHPTVPFEKEQIVDKSGAFPGHPSSCGSQVALHGSRCAE